MSKKAISSLELSALIHELQFIVKGKVSQIYHLKDELLLQLHAPGKGKQLLKIVPGKFICLTKEKEAPIRPSGFCMQLRKYLDNAFIKDIYQHDSERIVIFDLEKKDRFFFIVELFSKGNIILADKNHVIITSLERQIWKDRVIKPHEKYFFPKSDVNWKNVTEKQLSTIIKKSEKKNVAIVLATEVRFGGVYAEEICKRAEVDKQISPDEVSSNDVKKIVGVIKDLQKEIIDPKGHFYENDITPVPLTGLEATKVTNTYNEAINTINPFEKASPYEKKIKGFEKRIEEQEMALKNQEGKIDRNSKIGELIYEKYGPLQKLLDIVAELRGKKEWKEIAAELKKEKKIKSVDLKNKKIVISLQ